MKKSDKFEAVSGELNQKIEAIMGPTIEDAPSEHAKTASKITSKSMPIVVTDGSAKVTVEGAPALPKDQAVDNDAAAPESAPTEIPPTPVAATDDPIPDEDLPPPTLEDDPDIGEAVDDITAKESDEILAAQDETVAKAFQKDDHSWKQKIKQFFVRWWQNPIARWATILVLLLAVVTAAAVPTSRYFVLNTVGVRSSASLKVFDDSTQQPLKNVQVSLRGQTVQTNDEGTATFAQLTLGPTNLVIKKRAFAPINTLVTVGWGSNPLGEFKVTPSGEQHTFVVKDFLSETPLSGATAESGDANAKADQDGKIVLTFEHTEAATAPVTITATGYRDEKLTLNLDARDPITVHMTPSRSHAFVSKRSGKYDLYKIDVDGKNEKKVLAGTGNEQDDIALIQHPTANVAAMVATRETTRNSDGFLLSNLTMVNLSDDATQSLGKSEQFQLVGWVGDRLVYVQIAAGASANNPRRQRLLSYDYKQKQTKELASSNYFNDILLTGGIVYYAPSSALSGSAGAMYKINADGSSKQTLVDQDVSSIFRVDYDHLLLAQQQKWYSYKLGDAKATLLTNTPHQVNRLYIDSPDRTRSLWQEERDGKGTLLVYDPKAKTDKVIHAQSGLKYPIEWVNGSTVIYRISTPQETADYVISSTGGTPRKLRDVTNTSGVGRWYYY